MGIYEYQAGIVCVNDIAAQDKLKTEDKKPKLLAEIRDIMGPYSELESNLRTTAVRHMVDRTVHKA